jgi:hypothetical protein
LPSRGILRTKDARGKVILQFLWPVAVAFLGDLFHVPNLAHFHVKLHRHLTPYDLLDGLRKVFVIVTFVPMQPVISERVALMSVNLMSRISCLRRTDYKVV